MVVRTVVNTLHEALRLARTEGYRAVAWPTQTGPNRWVFAQNIR